MHEVCTQLYLYILKYINITGNKKREKHSIPPHLRLVQADLQCLRIYLGFLWQAPLAALPQQREFLFGLNPLRIIITD